jgi:hypothetical protein
LNLRITLSASRETQAHGQGDADSGANLSSHDCFGYNIFQLQALPMALDNNFYLYAISVYLLQLVASYGFSPWSSLRYPHSIITWLAIWTMKSIGSSRTLWPLNRKSATSFRIPVDSVNYDGRTFEEIKAVDVDRGSFIWFDSRDQIWLMTIYRKNEATDLTPDSEKDLKTAIDAETKSRAQK